MTGKTKTEPQVYVACLGCYNEGRMHGSWVDADELEERWDYAEEHDRQDRAGNFNKCPRPFHDEWAIHDYDGVPNLGEHPDIPYLIKVMRAIDSQTARTQRAFLAWFNRDPHNMSHHDDLNEAFEEAYCGEWESPEAFAEQMADDWGFLPSADEKNPNPLFAFVDFERWWKSALRFDYDFSNGHVFRGDV